MNYNEIRRKTKKIKVGNIFIGGDAPVWVQSMTNTPTEDYKATYSQIKALERAGCDIVRLAVPTKNAVNTIFKLKCSDITIPIVADIHFNHRIALMCADAGADKIRINPGNIGDNDRVKAVADKCREKNIPIRIGINSGSLEKKILAKYGSPTAQALAESALDNISLLEKYDFNNIIVAIKSSDVQIMTAANAIVAAKCDYPIHLGVTEAGSEHRGSIKSAIGIGSSLLSGIGDTVRVSLTADPLSEVRSAKEILDALGIRQGGYIDLVSCPTCGRTKVDIIELVRSFEERIDKIKPDKKLTVAIMGCVVNGPGEACEADIGIAGGVNEGVLFKKGKMICRVPEDEIVDRLIKEINDMIS